MSYENVPKNLLEKAVLTREGKPDYSKLAAEAFPVPTADEEGAVLENTDTGDKYVWTGLLWQPTHLESKKFSTPYHRKVEMLDILFLNINAANLTLAADTAIDDRTLTLTAGHGLTTALNADHVIEMDSSSHRFMQAKIMTVVGDIVTLDAPISDIFTTADTLIYVGNWNMAQDAATGVAIDGSITPVIFTLQPSPSQIGDITRVTMASTSSNDSDLTTFGGAAALSPGITLRVKRPDGSYKNLYTYKSNFDLALHGFDTNEYLAKVNTTKGFGGRVTFGGLDKHGAAVRLDGALFEEMQLVISELMDNTATGNESLAFIGEGAELEV